ncbi:MAG: phosphatidylglycerophosphatase A [Deferribacteraceae bacterium]|jgi:phosphatidylglycerophosphatase A|nr:phosphatidylglycerophosphatase A [Deferribacteraceae bacterium]
MAEEKGLTNEDGFFKRASFFLASVFGIGFIKYASGTFGSLVALPLAWLMLLTGGINALLICILVVGVIGYGATALALRYAEDEDPSFIVIDELVAQMMVFVPSLLLFPALNWSPVLYIAGFAFFRLFDIAKPWHVGQVDRDIHGAFGVMLDDIVAAFYASVCTALCMLIYGLITAGVPTEAVL